MPAPQIDDEDVLGKVEPRVFDNAGRVFAAGLVKRLEETAAGKKEQEDRLRAEAVEQVRKKKEREERDARITKHSPPVVMKLTLEASITKSKCNLIAKVTSWNLTFDTHLVIASR